MQLVWPCWLLFAGGATDPARGKEAARASTSVADATGENGTNTRRSDRRHCGAALRGGPARRLLLAIGDDKQPVSKVLSGATNGS